MEKRATQSSHEYGHAVTKALIYEWEEIYRVAHTVQRLPAQFPTPFSNNIYANHLLSSGI